MSVGNQGVQTEKMYSLKKLMSTMSRNLMRMALLMAATAAYAQDDIFGCSSPRLDAPSGNILSDKQKCQPKAQHEFTIKGIKIMAASKKDAIKKFNHRKK